MKNEGGVLHAGKGIKNEKKEGTKLECHRVSVSALIGDGEGPSSHNYINKTINVNINTLILLIIL